MRFIDKYTSAISKFYNALGRIAGLLLGLATILASINAISRKAFNFSFSWAEELCTYLCVMLVFIIISWLESEDLHLSIDIFQTTVKNKWIKKSVYILRGIITIAIFAILIKSGINTVTSTFNSQAVTYILHIKRYMLYSIVVISYVMVIVAWLSIYLNKGRKLR